MADKKKKPAAKAAPAVRVSGLPDAGVAIIDEFRKSTRVKNKRWFTVDPNVWLVKVVPCSEPIDIQRRAVISALAETETEHDKVYADQLSRVNRLRDFYEFQHRVVPEATILLFHEDIKMAGMTEPKKKAAAGVKKAKTESPAATTSYLVPSERDLRLLFNFGTQRFQKNKAVNREQIDLSALGDNRANESATDGSDPVPTIDYKHFGDRIYVPCVLLRIWDEWTTNKNSAAKDDPPSDTTPAPAPAAAAAAVPAKPPAKKPSAPKQQLSGTPPVKSAAAVVASKKKLEVKLDQVSPLTKMRFSNLPETSVYDFLANHDPTHTMIDADSLYAELGGREKHLDPEEPRVRTQYTSTLTRNLITDATIDDEQYIENFIDAAHTPDFLDGLATHQATYTTSIDLLRILNRRVIQTALPPPPAYNEKAVANMINKALEKQQKEAEKAFVEQTEKQQKLLASHIEASKGQSQEFLTRLKKQEDTTTDIHQLLKAMMAKVDSLDTKISSAAKPEPAPAPTVKQKPAPAAAAAAAAATATATVTKPVARPLLKPAPQATVKQVAPAATPAPAAAASIPQRPIFKRPQVIKMGPDGAY